MKHAALLALLLASFASGCRDEDASVNEDSSNGPAVVEVRISEILSDVEIESSWISSEPFDKFLRLSDQTVDLLDDPEQTREWLNKSVRSDNPENELEADVRAEDTISSGRMKTLLHAIAQHEQITRLTLVEDFDYESNPRRDFDFDIVIRKVPRKPDAMVFPDLRVHLETAGAEGETATSVILATRNLGNGDEAFDHLNIEILKVIGRPGDPITDDMQVRISADNQVPYGRLRQAVQAVSGGSLRGGRPITYIRNVALAGVGATDSPHEFLVPAESQNQPADE